MPAWNGGSPSTTGVASSVSVARRTSSGSPSPMPASSCPIQRARPSSSVSVAAVRTPMNEYRDHTPASADSNRNVPSRAPQSSR